MYAAWLAQKYKPVHAMIRDTRQHIGEGAVNQAGEQS